MSPEEFTSLPVGMQVKLILRAFPAVEKAVLALEVPQLPLAPKFDSRIRRKDGFQWASETDLEGLRFWHKRAAESSDPKFAEKNQKEAKSLEYWIRWRECFGDTAWNGERNHANVTALPPAKKPTVHQWEARIGDAPRAASRVNASALDADDDVGAGDYGF